MKVSNIQSEKQEIIGAYFANFVNADFVQESSEKIASWGLPSTDPLINNIQEMKKKLKQPKIPIREVQTETKPNKMSKLLEKLQQVNQQKKEEEEKTAEKLKNLYSLLEEEKTSEVHEMLKQDPVLQSRYFEETGREAEVLFEREVLEEYHQIMADNVGYTVKELKNYRMMYKMRSDNIMLLKFDSDVIKRNTIDFLTLLCDTEKFSMWYPMCEDSKVVKQNWRSRKTCRILANIPVLSNRDFVMYGFGSNDLEKDRTISIFAKSIDGTEISKKFQEERKGIVRGLIHNLCFRVEVLNENEFKFSGVLCSDPKVDLIPAWLQAFLNRKLVCEMFTMIFDILKAYRGSKYESKKKNKWLQEFVDFIQEQKNKFIS